MVDLFGATEMARLAAIEDAQNPNFVGDLVAIEADDERISTYLFQACLPGYGGWCWAVTVAKLDNESPATLCDVVLLPGIDSLIAPEWLPYLNRIQPGDVGIGDIVPTAADDERLVPGYAALPGEEELEAVQIWELGLGRARTLSIIGRDQASKRWYEGDRGPHSPMAQQAPAPCASCGFFIPIAGSLRSAFGVCSNAISPEDARVVSVDHGCGAHSEALVLPE